MVYPIMSAYLNRGPSPKSRHQFRIRILGWMTIVIHVLWIVIFTLWWIFPLIAWWIFPLFFVHVYQRVYHHISH